MTNYYSIGQIAKITELNTQTIRFYEKKGLILEPLRSESGYRQYTENSIERINFIKSAKKLGFTLNEIKELLSYSLRTKNDRLKAKDKINKKILEIEKKLKDLKMIYETLKNLKKRCEEGRCDDVCPILAHISHNPR